MSGALSRGIFGSNRSQKLCSSNFCVFESVLAFRNTKTGRRVLVKGSSKATRAQMLPMSLRAHISNLAYKYSYIAHYVSFTSLVGPMPGSVPPQGTPNTFCCVLSSENVFQTLLEKCLTLNSTTKPLGHETTLSAVHTTHFR